MDMHAWVNCICIPMCYHIGYLFIGVCMDDHLFGIAKATRGDNACHFSSSLSAGAPALLHTSSPAWGTSPYACVHTGLLACLGSDEQWRSLYQTPDAEDNNNSTWLHIEMGMYLKYKVLLFICIWPTSKTMIKASLAASTCQNCRVNS